MRKRGPTQRLPIDDERAITYALIEVLATIDELKVKVEELKANAEVLFRRRAAEAHRPNIDGQVIPRRHRAGLAKGR
jgi:hypothetical protein